MNFNEGVVITGRTGGGKTSFIDKIVPLLPSNTGMLWFTAKSGEANHAEKVIHSIGRASDLIRFDPCTQIVFNPITYVMSRDPNGSLFIAKALQDVHKVMHRAEKSGEAFWEGHSLNANLHATNVTWLGLRQHASLEAMYQFLSGVPESTAQAHSASFAQSKAGRLLAAANASCKNESEKRQAALATDYFMEQLPAAGEKVRGAVLSQVLNTLSFFVSPPVSQVLNGTTTYDPMEIIQNHRCVILDYEIMTYGEPALAFQLLMSFFHLEAVLRRTDVTHPFAFIRDEYQLYCHPERDIKAQTIARSQNFISIAAFQTLPVLQDGLGGGMESRIQAKALYACHVNKFMCNNNCPETNDENSKIIGYKKKLMYSISPNHQQSTGSLWDDFFGVGGMNISGTQHMMPLVDPYRFTQLRTGGEVNRFFVDAYYHNGRSHELVTINQRK